ncbi:MAG: tRNA pseudouridine(54/55) synthase Pus10 [Candidatus Anstonellaceae archaeon]
MQYLNTLFRKLCMKFHLCKLCISRFPPSNLIVLENGDSGCFICNGLLSNVQFLLQRAYLLGEEFEWRSFAISSSFPKDVLIREQEVCDCFCPGQFTSIKNSVNSQLGKLLSRAIKKENSQREPEAFFSFDFAKSEVGFKVAPIYIFGRYLKFSRKHCQSRWQCWKCGGKGKECCSNSGNAYHSVEEELAKAFLPVFEGENAILHASGREDVDVRNLGGRPFVMEILSPKKRSVQLSVIEKELKKNKAVQAFGLRFASKSDIEAVCNSHFVKEYEALVSADRALGRQDCSSLRMLNGATIRQETPTRVLGRRANIVRERKIFSISAFPAQSGKLKVRITAEAGTYIKELISSDGGRTKPSFSSILGCNAVCEELDVVRIYDFFLETLQKLN